MPTGPTHLPGLRHAGSIGTAIMAAPVLQREANMNSLRQLSAWLPDATFSTYAVVTKTTTTADLAMPRTI